MRYYAQNQSYDFTEGLIFFSNLEYSAHMRTHFRAQHVLFQT